MFLIVVPLHTFFQPLIFIKICTNNASFYIIGIFGEVVHVRLAMDHIVRLKTALSLIEH